MRTLWLILNGIALGASVLIASSSLLAGAAALGAEWTGESSRLAMLTMTAIPFLVGAYFSLCAYGLVRRTRWLRRVAGIGFIAVGALLFVDSREGGISESEREILFVLILLFAVGPALLVTPVAEPGTSPERRHRGESST